MTCLLATCLRVALIDERDGTEDHFGWCRWKGKRDGGCKVSIFVSNKRKPLLYKVILNKLGNLRKGTLRFTIPLGTFDYLLPNNYSHWLFVYMAGFGKKKNI